MLRSKVSFGVAFALFIAAILACDGRDETDDNNFRQDVIECEEALAKLDQCCPDFNSTRVLCNYYYSYREGCGTSTTTYIYPALSKLESKCIRERSCETLQTNGICDRAQEAVPLDSKFSSSSSSSTSSASSSTTSTGGTTRTPVCP